MIGFQKRTRDGGEIFSIILLRLNLQCTTSWRFSLDMFSLFFVHCPKVISCIFLDEEVSLQLYYVLSLCARGADDSGPGRGFLLKLQAPSAFIRTSSVKHELKEL